MTIDSFWTAIKDNLPADLPRKARRCWIDPLRPARIDGREMVLACPNEFFRSWLKEHYSQNLDQAVSLAGVPIDSISFEIAPEIDQVPDTPLPRQPELPHIGLHPAPLKPARYTFDRFVIGQSNHFAYSAALALANGREIQANCIYSLSDHGLGKSHLAQALGQHILSQDPRQRIYCLTAEDFTNELVHSLKTNCIEDFKTKYRRGCDVLILEEIHFLSGKEKIQAELCYTLDCLADENKRIVFTSSSRLKDIPRLGRQLVSRMSAALMSAIDPPDFDTRLRILERKAQEAGLAVSETVLGLLAAKLIRDVRQLESSIYSIGAKSKLQDRPIDLVLAREVIEDLADADSTKPDLTTITETICRFFQITPDALTSNSRRKEAVRSRNMAMYLSRQMTDLPLTDIGRAFGRNHSTVLYAINKTESLIKKDSLYRRQVEFLKDQIEKGFEKCSMN